MCIRDRSTSAHQYAVASRDRVIGNKAATAVMTQTHQAVGSQDSNNSHPELKQPISLLPRPMISLWCVGGL